MSSEQVFTCFIPNFRHPKEGLYIGMRKTVLVDAVKEGMGKEHSSLNSNTDQL